MKYLIPLILLTLSFNALAECNLSAGYTRINQKLFGTIDLQQDGATIGGACYHKSGLGLRLNLSRSLETGNALYEANRFLTNKVDFMSEIKIAYMLPVTDNFRLIAAWGLTDYKSTWKQDNVEPAWSKGTDSGKGASYGFQYDFASKDLAWEVMIGKPYDKMKEGFGREETYILSSLLVWKF